MIITLIFAWSLWFYTVNSKIIENLGDRNMYKMEIYKYI